MTSVGYGNKALPKALHRQVDSLIHTSNWFYNREQNEAGRLLTEVSFPGKTLFVNSGTEANEAAIKLARRYGLSQGKDRYQIITFTNSFHGRTYGGMSATAQKKIHDGFGPLVPGFIYLPFNDIKAFAKEMKKQPRHLRGHDRADPGRGRHHRSPNRSSCKEMFRLCNKNDILTIVDEVQTGIGRTGAMFALPALWRGAGHHHHGEGAGRRRADRRHPREELPAGVFPGGRARHAPSAGTIWPARRRPRC